MDTVNVPIWSDNLLYNGNSQRPTNSSNWSNWTNNKYIFLSGSWSEQIHSISDNHWELEELYYSATLRLISSNDRWAGHPTSVREVVVHWRIKPNFDLPYPTWIENITYDGLKHTPTGATYWNNWSNAFSISFEPDDIDPKIDAGVHLAIFTPNGHPELDEYVYDSGFVGQEPGQDYNEAWYIDPLGLTPPAWTGQASYEYNGSQQGPPSYSAPSSTYCSISGNGTTSKIYPGSYAIDFELVSEQNLYWTDSQGGPVRTLTWTIVESTKYVRIYTNGAWHRAIPYIYYQSSTESSARWHKSEAYVYNNNAWKDTTS